MNSVLFYMNLFNCLNAFPCENKFKKTLAVITAEISFLLAISELINCTFSFTKFDNANVLSLNCLNIETRCKIKLHFFQL